MLGRFVGEGGQSHRGEQRHANQDETQDFRASGQTAPDPILSGMAKIEALNIFLISNELQSFRAQAICEVDFVGPFEI
jgi:hypothetical protein